MPSRALPDGSESASSDLLAVPDEPRFRRLESGDLAAQGRGALQGLGEKFVPDLHTGTGNFTVPITVPAGRNGFHPELTLAYSTGAGNGPFGLGWSLGVPGVTRRTAKGIPRYEDEHDVFILSGAEDLVRVGDDANGRTRYRPRTEGLFALIERRRDASNDVWEVRGKDGLVSVYGTPGRRGDDPAVLTSPEDSTRIFGWHLTETRDLFGNRIVYEYAADQGQEAGHRWRRPLLTRIRYADHSDQRFLVSVTFEYAERPDPFSEYRAGFEVRTSLRCTSILTTTDAERERPVRQLRLWYLDQRPDPAGLPSNGVSLLSEVEVVGYDDAGVEHAELPALEFGYTRFEPFVGRDLRALTGVDLPAGSLGRPEYELADLTGNGLPDMLELNGAARFWANLGDCRFDAPRPLTSAPDGVALADPGVQLIDADGDGRIDLLITSAGVNGFVSPQHPPEGNGPEFHPHLNAPTFDLTDPEVRLVDLDGDGVVDALRTADRLEHYFNHADKGWYDERIEERRPLHNLHQHRDISEYTATLIDPVAGTTITSTTDKFEQLMLAAKDQMNSALEENRNTAGVKLRRAAVRLAKMIIVAGRRAAGDADADFSAYDGFNLDTLHPIVSQYNVKANEPGLWRALARELNDAAHDMPTAPSRTTLKQCHGELQAIRKNHTELRGSS